MVLRVVWLEDTALRPGSGHGVDFFDGLPSDETLVAHIVGFDWLHGEPEAVEIRFCATTRSDVRATGEPMRDVVESYLAAKGPISMAVEEIRPEFYVIVNG